MATHQLVNYLRAASGLSSPYLVVHHETSQQEYSDNGLVIKEISSIITFDNGVVIEYHTEQDDDISEQVCREMWITFKVINDNGFTISPRQKNFHNSCQQAFWLKMNPEAQG